MTVSSPMDRYLTVLPPAPDNAVDTSVDRLCSASRSLVEAVLCLELRLATLATVTESYGARYTDRVTAELQAAAEHVHLCETLRRTAMAAARDRLGLAESATLADVTRVAPEPFQSLLRTSRADLTLAKDRIGILRARAEDVLGRRISLVSEVLRSPETELDPTYGRTSRPRPHLVSNLL